MPRFAGAVFVLLVGATFAAFFVAQELKSRPPVVELERVTVHFSPNGDGRRDVNRIAVSSREPEVISLSIVDADGDVVRRLRDSVPRRAYQWLRAWWDGRDDAGRRVPDGVYRVRVNLRRQGRTVDMTGPLKTIQLDTTPPQPVVRLAKGQSAVVSREGEPVQFVARGLGRREPGRFSVWRTDVTPARRVAAFEGTRKGARGTWSGTIDGRPAPPGVYLIRATATDRAGNVGSSAPGLPDLPESVRGKPGVTVRSLAVQPPAEPVRAGRPVTFLVDSRRRTYRWKIRRVGSKKTITRGRGRPGRPLTVRAPRGPSGVYLLEVAIGATRRQVPFAVQGPPSKLLVVLPAITWLGSERADEDGDGLPDTLPRGSAVPWPRVMGNDGSLPAGFAGNEAPMLSTLDRAKISYDVTTDIALARAGGPRRASHTGVLFPAPLRWIPPQLGKSLRSYVRDGGRVATFGVETMQRGVTVRPRQLLRPTRAVDSNPFAAELLEPRSLAGTKAPAALEPLEERGETGLLEGTDGVLTGFDVVQESHPASRPGEQLLVALGQPLSDEEATQADQPGADVREVLPAITAKKQGRGLAIRVGVSGWGDRLQTDSEVRQLNRNVIDLLRGVRPRQRSLR